MSRVGNESTIIDSKQDIRRDTVEVDDSRHVGGGVGVFQKPGENARLLRDSYGGDFNTGIKDQALYNQVIGNYSKALSEYGISLNSESAQSFAREAHIGLNTGIAGQLTGIQGGASANHQVVESGSTRYDVANVLARQATEQAITDGNRAADQHVKVLGPDAAAHFDRNAYVASFAEQRLNSALFNTRQAAAADASIANRNDAVLNGTSDRIQADREALHLTSPAEQVSRSRVADEKAVQAQLRSEPKI